MFLFFYRVKSNTFEGYYITIMIHFSQNTSTTSPFYAKGTATIFGTTTNTTTLWGC